MAHSRLPVRMSAEERMACTEAKTMPGPSLRMRSPTVRASIMSPTAMSVTEAGVVGLGSGVLVEVSVGTGVSEGVMVSVAVSVPTMVWVGWMPSREGEEFAPTEQAVNVADSRRVKNRQRGLIERFL